MRDSMAPCMGVDGTRQPGLNRTQPAPLHTSPFQTEPGLILAYGRVRIGLVSWRLRSYLGMSGREHTSCTIREL